MYEREEVKPSIKMAGKLADALKVFLDYLAGKLKAFPLQMESAITGWIGNEWFVLLCHFWCYAFN
jgi:transcriptional regulator with XRE-family HTH domain